MTLLRKPVSIVLIGLYYILSPILNLIQIEWVTRLPLSGPVNLWNTLSALDWTILVAFPVVGWGLLSVRRWGWVAFVSFTLFLIAYNSVAFAVNGTYNLGVVILYNLVLALVTFVFFRKHLRAPYFNPRLRWWNADPRYPVELSAVVLTERSSCDSEILDISKSGVFLSTCADIEVGRTYQIVVQAYGEKFPCHGKVMRKTLPNDPKPGFGLMFEGLEPATRREVQLLLARLIKEGARERGLPPNAPTAKDPWLRHLAWHGRRLWSELTGS